MNPGAEVCTALSAGSGTDLYVGGEFEYSGDKVACNVAHWHRSSMAVDELRPGGTARLFLASSPNPFGQSTVLRFSAPREGEPVRLTIHDSSGRPVRMISDQALRNPGSVVWDGEDSRGRPLPAGVYYGRLQIGMQVGTWKIVRAR
jgi:hypothetical protein